MYSVVEEVTSDWALIFLQAIKAGCFVIYWGKPCLRPLLGWDHWQAAQALGLQARLAAAPGFCLGGCTTTIQMLMTQKFAVLQENLTASQECGLSGCMLASALKGPTVIPACQSIKAAVFWFTARMCQRKLLGLVENYTLLWFSQILPTNLFAFCLPSVITE